MKIVLGIDPTPNSTATVSFLCGMAWPRDTSFMVVAAVAPTEPHFAPEPSMVASVAGAIGLIEERAVEAHRELLARAEKMLREAGLVATGQVRYGDPRQVLVNAARTEAADLVVVGSHGPSGIARRVLGSVATYVTAHAPCSVMVVKRD